MKKIFTKHRKDDNKFQGFTLVELLIVVVIVSLIFSLVTPSIENLYTRYSIHLSAEKVLFYILDFKRRAFLFGEEIEIYEREGKLIICTTEGEEEKTFEDFIVEISQPIKFFSTGTTNGGVIKLKKENYTLIITIKAPLGDFLIEEKK